MAGAKEKKEMRVEANVAVEGIGKKVERARQKLRARDRIGTEKGTSQENCMRRILFEKIFRKQRLIRVADQQNPRNCDVLVY